MLGERVRRLNGITGSVDVNSCEVWETVRDRETRPAAVHGVPKVTGRD